MDRDEPWDANRNPYAPTQSIESPAFDDFDDDGELRPFRTIWFHPRRTVRKIVAVDPSLHVLLLVCLAGIGESLNRASTRNAGDDLSVPAIILLAILLGPLGGLFSLWLSSHLIRITGDWMGGIGNREHIKTAMAWAYVPAVFALPLWIPQLVLFGSDMFTEATPTLDAQPALLLPFLAIGLVEIVLGVWTCVLLCNTLAEVQGYRSAWKGLGNILLAGAAVLVPLLAIVFIVVMMSRP